MSIPQFRSTAAFTRRQRTTAPAIDRATLVIFALRGRRFAVPVESVERVLRYDAPDDRESLAYGGRSVPLVDLVRAIGLTNDGEPAHGHAARTRALIFSLQAQWVAATVDAIFEVATLDAATVRPLPPSMSDVWSDLPSAPWTAGARGVLTRADSSVIVLDIARVMRTLFELDQAARISMPVPSR